VTAELYSNDPTQRADEIAQEMRDYYESNKPIHWWQRRRKWEKATADELMLGLLDVAGRAMRAAAEQDRARFVA
jgi:hypothetical protein